MAQEVELYPLWSGGTCSFAGIISPSLEAQIHVINSVSFKTDYDESVGNDVWTSLILYQDNGDVLEGPGWGDTVPAYSTGYTIQSSAWSDAPDASGWTVESVEQSWVETNEFDPSLTVYNPVLVIDYDENFFLTQSSTFSNSNAFYTQLICQSVAVAGEMSLTASIATRVTHYIGATMEMGSSLIGAFVKYLSGEISLSGIHGLRGSIVNLSGSISISGTVWTIYSKILSGGIALSGTVTRFFTKEFAGSMSFSGTISILKTHVVDLAGSVPLTGNLGAMFYHELCQMIGSIVRTLRTYMTRSEREIP